MLVKREEALRRRRKLTVDGHIVASFRSLYSRQRSHLGRFCQMTIGALFRSVGWTGMIAGLVAFLMVGAFAPRAAVAQSQMHQAQVVSLIIAPVGHAADHHHIGGHSHGHADHSAASDTCKDGCCGSGGHALPGRAGDFAATSGWAAICLLPVADRFADNGLQYSIDRPPRV